MIDFIYIYQRLYGTYKTSIQRLHIIEEFFAIAIEVDSEIFACDLWIKIKDPIYVYSRITRYVKL